MPIDTGADAWREEGVDIGGGGDDQLAVEATFFLREHPEKAFTALELADELLGTDWAAVVGDGDVDDATRRGFEVATAGLQASLATVVASGDVEMHTIPADETDALCPAGDSEVAHYSIA